MMYLQVSMRHAHVRCDLVPAHLMRGVLELDYKAMGYWEFEKFLRDWRVLRPSYNLVVHVSRQPPRWTYVTVAFRGCSPRHLKIQTDHWGKFLRNHWVDWTPEFGNKFSLDFRWQKEGF